MREKFHQKTHYSSQETRIRKRIRDRNRDPARKFPTIVQTNLIFPFFEHFQGYSISLLLFCLCLRVREKEREVSCVYYHLLVAECQALRIPFPRQYSHISSFRWPCLFSPLPILKPLERAPFHPFSFRSPKRETHRFLTLAHHRGTSSPTDVAILMRTGANPIFSGQNGGTLIDSKLRSLFYGDYCFFISRSGKLLNCRVCRILLRNPRVLVRRDIFGRRSVALINLPGNEKCQFLSNTA